MGCMSGIPELPGIWPCWADRLAVDSMQIKSHEWVGIVLAGGRSRRMGQPKAQLPWPGAAGTHSWQDHAVTCLQQVCAHVRVSGAAELPDLHPGQPGPLAGIAAALTAFPGQHCLFLPVDMPRVTRADLTALQAVDTAHAAYRDSLFPLALYSTPDCLHRVQARLSAQTPQARSVKALVADLGAELSWLNAAEPQRLCNINTPEDLKTLAQLQD